MTVDPIKHYEFHDFRLDVENQQLLKNGNHLPLTHKALQVLEFLVANAGHATSKTAIFEQLWCGSFVEDGNLTQHIHVLRKVMGPMPDGGSYVETVPRFGYRFALNADQIFAARHTDDADAGPRFMPANLPMPERGSGRFQSALVPLANAYRWAVRRVPGTKASGGSDGTRLPTQKGRVNIRVTLSIAVMLMIIESVAAPTYYYFTSSTPSAPTQQAAPIKSIAVMPFKPIGEKVDKEKFGFGMTDAVITNLSKIKQVAVRSTSAMSRYASEPSTDASAAGRALAVDGVLEGIVQCDGESLRVSVQLIRVEDGKPMWAESFHEKVSDNFTMQDSISSKVAVSLSNNLAQPDVVAHSPFSEVPTPEDGETHE